MVMNRVLSHPTRARIPPRRAAPVRRRALLSRCIGDVVARALAAALERMQQSEPVADFVHGGLAVVEAVVRPAPRQRVGKDVAPVAVVGARPADADRTAAVPRGAVEALLDVDVQVVVAAPAQLLHHPRLVLAVGPRRVDGARRPRTRERDAVLGVLFLHDVELLGQSLVLFFFILFSIFSQKKHVVWGRQCRQERR